MNTFNVSKRCILSYEEFLKDRKKAEDAKHTEKGEADIVKKSMDGEKEGKKGYATLSESEEIELALYEKKFSKEARVKLADKGFAMPDGSFPISSPKDLRNAIKAAGRSKDKEAAQKHIKKRAKQLQMSHLIPKEWK